MLKKKLDESLTIKETRKCHSVTNFLFTFRIFNLFFTPMYFKLKFTHKKASDKIQTEYDVSINIFIILQHTKNL